MHIAHARARERESEMYPWFWTFSHSMLFRCGRQKLKENRFIGFNYNCEMTSAFITEHGGFY